MIGRLNDLVLSVSKNVDNPDFSPKTESKSTTSSLKTAEAQQAFVVITQVISAHHKLSGGPHRRLSENGGCI